MTSRASNNQPQPTPAFSQNATSPPSKRDLASWWKSFKRNPKKEEEKTEAPIPDAIFGIPLQTSVRYANVAISLVDADGNQVIYGYVPIVVAKCGVFLKEKATDVQGIFRLAGAEKRIKELQVIFDSPDRYGKGLDWTGYTVHDAANVLRRYFNQLPEPIIPLDFYERFREPLRNYQARAVGNIEGSIVGPIDQEPDDFDEQTVIRTYQKLVTELPPLNRQLLLYILDLLAVFASKSDLNKMTSPNLSAIFQPGILSHPSHDMAPQEYRLSQNVLIFLIENQDHFLIGMQGTAADEKTVQEVQGAAVSSQVRTPTAPGSPSRGRLAGLRRSASVASNTDNSPRGRVGVVGRNVSTSSQKSRQSNNSPSPASPQYATPAGSPGVSGIHRSNTMPSKKSPAIHATRFLREPGDKTSYPSTPTAGDGRLQAPFTLSPPSSEGATPTGPYPGLASSSGQRDISTVAPTTLSTGQTIGGAARPSSTIPPVVGVMGQEMRLAKPDRSAVDAFTISPQQGTPTKDRSFSSLFSKSPESVRNDGRRPNKLQKKRIPGSGSVSAQSSTVSLHSQDATSSPNALVPIAPAQGYFDGVSQWPAGSSAVGAAPVTPGAEPFPIVDPAMALPPQQAREISSSSTFSSQACSNGPAPLLPSSPHKSTGATLRPTVSPSGSVSHSSLTSEDPYAIDDVATSSAATPVAKEKRRHRWRFSSSAAKDKSPFSSLSKHGESRNLSTSTGVGSSVGRESGRSTTSIGMPQKGFAEENSRNDRGVSGGGSAIGPPPDEIKEQKPNTSVPVSRDFPSQNQTQHSALSEPNAHDNGANNGSESEAAVQKRGPLAWAKGKWAERKERDEKDKIRERSPAPSAREQQSHSSAAGVLSASGLQTTSGQPIIPVPNRTSSRTNVEEKLFSTQASAAASSTARPTAPVSSYSPISQAQAQSEEHFTNGPFRGSSDASQYSPLSRPAATSALADPDEQRVRLSSTGESAATVKPLEKPDDR